MDTKGLENLLKIISEEPKKDKKNNDNDALAKSFVDKYMSQCRKDELEEERLLNRTFMEARKIIDELDNNEYMRKLAGVEDIYANKDGDIYRISYSKKHGAKLKPVGISLATNGKAKFNVYEGGVCRSCMAANLIWVAFYGEPDSDIVYLDGNTLNCSLDNLRTVNQLIEFYNEHK